MIGRLPDNNQLNECPRIGGKLNTRNSMSGNQLWLNPQFPTPQSYRTTYNTGLVKIHPKLPDFLRTVKAHTFTVISQ